MYPVLDPRIKIFSLLFATVYMGIQLNSVLEILLILIYISPFFLAGLYKWGYTFLSIYIIQLLLSLFLLPHIKQAFTLFILSYLTNGLRFLLPSMVAGAYSIKTTSINKWIAALHNMHIPNQILIPLAVMTRFFPTIYEDYQSIRKAMAFRGVSTNIWGLIRHPIQTLEFILIPLLMNAVQVAEDLTIASLTKGLSLAKNRTTLTPLRMTRYDWIYAILVFIPFIIYLGEVIL